MVSVVVPLRNSGNHQKPEVCALGAEITFEPLPADELEELASSIEIAYQLITVVLMEGDVLIGCLAKHWHWNGSTLWIGFNTAEGRRYGPSHVVQVPLDSVADIQAIPLSEGNTPKILPDDPSLEILKSLGLEPKEYLRLPVQDYPNPLARILCDHNLSIAENHDFQLSEYLEKALPRDAVPPQGIILNRDFLLYVDWEFFSRQLSGAASVSLSIPFASFSKGVSPSLNAEVISLLKGSWAQSLNTRMSRVATGERIVSGRMILPDAPHSTDIEGDNCTVVEFVRTGKADSESHAVLLKLRHVKYPQEFLGNIASDLTVYGEPLPVPIQIAEHNYQEVLLARAVGYLHM